mmetsp:Transcript_21389/g.42469  ORF Transcript_21389/g.42469 Transcript_21389/m.42469 type:complete len:80 (+) Transcript_21389:11-250(+)
MRQRDRERRRQKEVKEGQSTTGEKIITQKTVRRSFHCMSIESFAHNRRLYSLERDSLIPPTFCTHTRLQPPTPHADALP